ncbi:MAG: hypothetical protein AAFX93_16980 [Verrucomicrobiota bacterium]
MRAQIVTIVVLCLAAFLVITFLPETSQPDGAIEVKSIAVEPTDDSPKADGHSIEYLPEELQFNIEDYVPPPTVAEQLDFILTDAHVSSDKYLLLVELLRTHEAEVLAYLAERRYPESMEVEDPEFEEIEMITRAMMDFYREKPLAENLEKIEQLRATGPLFSSVVGDFFLAGSGAESADVAYDWIMSNPEDAASLRSGATIGTMLSNFTPEVAWSKAVDLPEGPIRARAFTAIVVESTAGDVNSAIDYINSIEETPDLDGAISSIVSLGIDKGYPYSELVDLAAAPVDPMYRSTSLVMLFHNWAAEDPSSLRDWASQEHEFPPDQMAEISLVVKQTLQRHQVEF